MLVRYCSDIHNDFHVQNRGEWWMPAPLETDSKTTLLILGDLWYDRKFLSFKNRSWLAEVAARFQHVIFVLGNHDLWGCNLQTEYHKVREEITKQGLTNVTLMQNSTLIIDDVKFVGGTLWTDMNRGDPLTVFRWYNDMKHDRKQIRIGNQYKKISADDLRAAHQKTKNHIFDEAFKSAEIRKVVVLSHHAPTCLSIDKRYIDDAIVNAFYYSDLGNQIAYSEIDYWFHGHTHDSFDYMAGDCRVLCNPVGYAGMGNAWFDNIALLDI